jgi:hypothetical protein
MVDVMYGNDNKDKRDGTPYRSVAAAMNAARPGDTIFLSPGTYDPAPLKSNVNLVGQGQVTMKGLVPSQLPVDNQSLVQGINFASPRGTIPISGMSGVQFQDCSFAIDTSQAPQLKRNKLNGHTVPVIINDSQVGFQHCDFYVNNPLERSMVQGLHMTGNSSVTMNGCSVYLRNSGNRCTLSLAELSNNGQLKATGNNFNIEDTSDGSKIVGLIHTQSNGHTRFSGNNIHISCKKPNQFHMGLSWTGNHDQIVANGNDVTFSQPENWQGKVFIGTAEHPSSTLLANGNSFNVPGSITPDHSINSMGTVRHLSSSASGLCTNGGLTTPIRLVSDNTNLRPDDVNVVIAAAHPITITLPPLSNVPSQLNDNETLRARFNDRSESKTIRIKALRGMVTHRIVAAPGNNIDVDQSVKPLAGHQDLTFQSHGSTWYTFGNA